MYHFLESTFYCERESQQALILGSPDQRLEGAPMYPEGLAGATGGREHPPQHTHVFLELLKELLLKTAFLWRETARGWM